MLKQIELAAAVKDRLTDVNPNKDLPVDERTIKETHLVISNDMKQMSLQSSISWTC